MEARSLVAGGVLIGAGTITTYRQVEAAVAAGADLLVSPHLDTTLLDSMVSTGLLSLPGVLIPSEVAAALGAGATVVKLFPAATVGLGHLRALHGPFPDLQVVPTCGVAPDTASAWLDAGALAIGLRSELVPADLLRAQAWEEIAEKAVGLPRDLGCARVQATDSHCGKGARI